MTHQNEEEYKVDILMDCFYKAYQEWLDAGAPDGDEVFSRGIGLCGLLKRYCDRKLPEFGLVIVAAGKVRLKGHFAVCGMDVVYPFGRIYTIECDNRMMHLNTARRKWVKERVAGKKFSSFDYIRYWPSRVLSVIHAKLVDLNKG